MSRFRQHQLNVLVATDLASRGLDVNAITHIINYDLPKDPEVYVHRIGRTARMGAFGQAISLVTREEGKFLTEVEMLINKEVVEEKVDGFTRRPPPEDQRFEESDRPAAPVLSRHEASVFGGGGSGGQAQPAPVQKTLGGKFKPARRRRR